MNEQLLNRCYKEIADNIRDGLLVVGEDGTILLVNKAMEQLTGFMTAELVGEPCTVLNCDACELVRSQSSKKWCSLFDVEQVKGKRCYLMRKDGTYIAAAKNAMLLKDENGAVLGALETFADLSEIDLRDQRILELQKLLNHPEGFHGMIGASPQMRNIYRLITKAAHSDAPVLILGESGTGKELAAQAIHQIGRRKEAPFVQFSCAALNESIVESELFGHIKGAFTGAHRHRMGRFEAAHGGDIFFDEIGEITAGTQVKLLRVIETKQFERIGDHRTVHVDVRVIAATNRDLQQCVELGTFRKDLFYRLNVIPIRLPPLRERREDIPVLIKFFLKRLQEQIGTPITGLRPEVMNLFMCYPWPGNVRELRSALEYAVVLADSEVITLRHLPEHLSIAADQGDHESVSVCEPDSGNSPDEKIALIEALRISRGNKTQAAKILGVNRMTVWNRMKRYNVQISKIIDG